MYYDEVFIKSLPSEPNQALYIICDRYWLYYQKYKKSQVDLNLRELVTETYALLMKFCEVIGLKVDLPIIEGGIQNINVNNGHDKILKIRDYAKGEAVLGQIDRYVPLFMDKYGSGFHYEFSEGDLERIQKLINEIRDLISASDKLEKDYKRRLLNKLEKFQSELHKKVSDLDRFWGFLIEASVVLRTMGENAKPIVNRIKELKDIIWPTQTRSFELPSNLPFKLLGQTENDKTDKKA